MAKQASVAGVVVRNLDGQFLLVQERNPKAYGKWNLPAGHTDEDETEQQAAIRETAEEVGLTVKLMSDKPLHTAEDPRSHRRLVSFQAEIVAGQLTPQESEILDAQWFTLDQIKIMRQNDQLRVDWVSESIDRMVQISPTK